MAGSPRFKVHRYGEYVASCKFAEDAAQLLAGYDGFIRDKWFGVVWTTKDDGATDDSFDDVATTMWQRINAR